MPNGRSRGRRRGRRPKRRSNEKGGRTVQTAAPALFAFMGSLSSSVGLSAWRWACAVPRCGSRCFRNGQRKAIIRTHRLSETGSDYIGLVPVAGLEPARHRWRWILSPLRLPIPSHRRYRDIISHGKRNSKYFLPFPGQKPVIPRCGSYRTDAWTAAPATRPCFRSAPGYPPERPDASARSSRSRGCRTRSGGHTRSAHPPPGR